MEAHFEAKPAITGSSFTALKKTTWFSLVRHGKSQGNEKGIFQGKSEYELSAEGRSQAAALGGKLAARAGVLVLCSPLLRAKQTAEELARAAGFAPPEVLEDLIEFDTGSFTGASWDQKQQENSAEWQAFRLHSWQAVSGAEKEAELYRRAVRAWEQLIEQAARTEAENVVAVTHGGFLQWLVRVTFGSQTWFPLLPVHNCCEYRLRVEPVSPRRATLFWEQLG